MAKAMKKPKATMAPSEIEQLLGQIEKAEKTLDVAELDWSHRKDVVKAAKGVRDQAVANLRSLCRTRERWLKEEGQQPLLAAEVARKAAPAWAEAAQVGSVTVGDTTFTARTGEDAA